MGMSTYPLVLIFVVFPCLVEISGTVDDIPKLAEKSGGQLYIH